MSAELFQVLVVGGIYTSATLLLWSLRDIAKLLAAILEQMRGEKDDERI